MWLELTVSGDRQTFQAYLSTFYPLETAGEMFVAPAFYYLLLGGLYITYPPISTHLMQCEVPSKLPHAIRVCIISYIQPLGTEERLDIDIDTVNSSPAAV